MSEIV